MTLDAARIDLRRAFVPGMGYVALSRVRSLATLSLVGINKMALEVSAEALEMDGVLAAKGAVDAERFAHLAERAAERAEGKVTERAVGRVSRDAEALDLGPVETVLFEALRGWRAEKARELEMPPYIVAHDKTLQLVAMRKPQSEAELLRVPGFGAKKVEDYGADIVRIVGGPTKV
jgi:ATP-dependent DNA helicase RecQ